MPTTTDLRLQHANKLSFDEMMFQIWNISNVSHIWQIGQGATNDMSENDTLYMSDQTDNGIRVHKHILSLYYFTSVKCISVL